MFILFNFTVYEFWILRIKIFINNSMTIYSYKSSLPGIMVKQNELHGISSKQVYNMSKSLSEETLSA